MGILAIIDSVSFFTANLTNNRPLCFMSTAGGIRDAVLGLGFILGLEEIRQTRLFQNYNELIPDISGPGAGWMFLIVGIFVAITALIDKTQWTRYGLRIQAFAWLFSAIMYAMHYDFVLALVFGVFFSVPAGYLAYYYKYAPLWAQQKREFVENWYKETRNDQSRDTG